jgi:hypothetical protein
VKRCSEILPRHVRDYIPYAITRARAVQRGPGAGEEVRPTAHSWLVDLRVFFSDICAWATEPDSPFKRFAPRTIPVTRHTFLGYGFEKARERTRARSVGRVGEPLIGVSAEPMEKRGTHNSHATASENGRIMVFFVSDSQSARSPERCRDKYRGGQVTY